MYNEYHISNPTLTSQDLSPKAFTFNLWVGERLPQGGQYKAMVYLHNFPFGYFEKWLMADKPKGTGSSNVHFDLEGIDTRTGSKIFLRGCRYTGKTFSFQHPVLVNGKPTIPDPDEGTLTVVG